MVRYKQGAMCTSANGQSNLCRFDTCNPPEECLDQGANRPHVQKPYSPSPQPQYTWAPTLSSKAGTCGFRVDVRSYNSLAQAAQLQGASGLLLQPTFARQDPRQPAHGRRLRLWEFGSGWEAKLFDTGFGGPIC